MSQHKEFDSLKQILVALVLLSSGVLAPSNGLDDRISKTPGELITTMFFLLSLALLLILLMKAAFKTIKAIHKHE